MKTLRQLFRRSTRGTVLLLVFGAMATEGQSQIQLREHAQGVTVTVREAPFADYLTTPTLHSGSSWQPVVWPIIGPSGDAVTRSYPLGERLAGEKQDHPHHQSLWFAHGDVNGHDFWHTPPQGAKANRTAIVHREFTKLESGAVATLVARNDWIAAGEPLLTDERTLVFGVEQEDAPETTRWIDFTIKLFAPHQDVRMGDTKEGTFAVRVAGAMKVDAGNGGTIVSSNGQRNAKAWGMPAHWVDYHGPVQTGSPPGTLVGIALLSHPTNARHPCRWQVRPYGLFAANPFGERDFPPATVKQGALTIPKGEHLTLRYRVVLHKGDQQQAQIERHYERFASED